jgi:hypothetical protein
MLDYLIPATAVIVAFVAVGLLIMAGPRVTQALFYPHMIDDEFITAIVAHVTETIRELDLGKTKRRHSQHLIEEAARHAVAEMWTAAFRGNYKPTRTWPRCVAILLEDQKQVVIDLWIGHDYHEHEIPRPWVIELGE